MASSEWGTISGLAGAGANMSAWTPPDAVSRRQQMQERAALLRHPDHVAGDVLEHGGRPLVAQDFLDMGDDGQPLLVGQRRTFGHAAVDGVAALRALFGPLARSLAFGALQVGLERALADAGEVADQIQQLVLFGRGQVGRQRRP